jgi:hypothetical protein
MREQLCLETENSNRAFGPYFYGYCQVQDPSSLYNLVRPVTLTDSLAEPFLPLAARDFDVSVKYFTNTGTTTAFETVNTVSGQKLYKNAVVVGLTKTFN